MTLSNTKNDAKSHIRRIGARLLALLLVIGILPITSIAQMETETAFAALPDAPGAIWNYPSQFEDWVPEDNTPVTMPLADLEWSTPPSIIHKGYDTGSYAAYTAATSKKFNGASTPDHVVFDNNTVRFLGYNEPAYMDMVFTNSYQDGFSSMSFTMRPIVMNFHTFSESGLLFNGSFNGNLYTGYALILKCGNMEGMLSNGKATLSLVFCQNEKMNGSSYSPGTLANTRTLIGTYKTGISNLSTPAYKIDIEYGVGGGFALYLDGQMVADVANPKSDATGFGFFTGYYSHACSILSVVEFEQVVTVVGGIEPVETNATVKFVDINTGLEIANPQTAPINAAVSYGSDKFKVTPPQTIGGYRYISADRDSLNPITYSKSPASNVITLYYDVDLEATKSASVNGERDNGSQDSPVQVSVGDQIDYTIAVDNPGFAIAVDSSGAASLEEIWTGYDYAIARDSNEDYYVWGNNNSGQLGLGDTANKTSPTLNPYLSGTSPVKDAGGNDIYLTGANAIEEIWAGYNYVIARLSNGMLYSWGNGGSGQLGIGGTDNKQIPVQIAFFATSGITVTKMWLGGQSNIAFASDGNYYVWGQNNKKQLGLGTTINEPIPVKNDEFKQQDIIDIYVCSGGTIVLDSEGKPYCTGLLFSLPPVRYDGKSYDVKPLSSRTISNDVEFISPAVSSNFTAMTFSDGNTSRTIVKLYGYGGDVIALASDGKYYGYGSNDNYTLALQGKYYQKFYPIDYLNGVSFVKNAKNEDILLKSSNAIVDIQMNGSYVVASTAAGEVYFWGRGSNGEFGLGSSYSYSDTPLVNPTLNNVRIQNIWAGGNFLIARMPDNQFYAWGNNNAGQLGFGDIVSRNVPTKNLALISAIPVFADAWTGYDFTIARTDSGRFYVWGGSTGLWLGDSGASANRTVPVLNPYLSGTRSVKDAGGNDIYLTGVNAIDEIWLGDDGVIARTNVGDFYGWGVNYYGDLGVGDYSSKSIPTFISELSNLKNTDPVVKICGLDMSSSVAITQSGSVYLCGNPGNAVSTGDVGNVSVFTRSPFLENLKNSGNPVVNIWANAGSNFALTKDGTFYVWGNNWQGQLGLGYATVFPPTDRGVSFTVNTALTQLGITDMWIASTYYALDGPTCVIVRGSDGKLYGWGDNSGGALGIGGGSTSPTLLTDLTDMNITDLWTGGDFCFARDLDGAIWSWGNNSNGQLGLGNSSGKALPAKNSFLSGMEITDIRTGTWSIIARTASGDAYAWGLNDYGQLGLGDTAGRNVPTKSMTYRFDAQSFTITDLLPAGLSLIESGGVPEYRITDAAGNPADVGDVIVSTGVESGRERITFTFTALPAGTTQFHFTVLVEEKGDFENTGQFFDGMTQKNYNTNATYHSTDVCITEKYQSLTGVSLQPDTRRFEADLDMPGKNYSPYTSTMRPITDADGHIWRYYGYKLDGGSLVVGAPPNGADGNWCYTNVTDNHDIILYFVEDVNLRIDYKSNTDRSGANLKTAYSTSVPGMVDYYMAVSHMNAINTWNYAGYYDLNDGSGVQSGVPPMPTYEAVQMTGNKVITLYFTQSFAVTVQYREYRVELDDRQNSQLLFNADGFNKETIVVDTTDFDPMLDSAFTGPISDGVTSITGKDYTIYQGWSDDGGVNVHQGEPPVFEDLGANKNIILYFSTSYIITEKFHENKMVHADEVLDPLMRDITTTVYGGDTFSGGPPAEIRDPNWIWTYVGYKIGNDQNLPLLVSDVANYVPPIITNVAGDDTIIYVYEKSPNPDRDVTIVERFREKDNTGHILQNKVTTTVKVDERFPGDYPEDITEDNIKYEYWGYQIDNEDPIPGPFLGLTADSGHTVTYLYEAVVSQGYILHVRQIILDPDTDQPVAAVPGFSLPVIAYYRLTSSNNEALPITSNSLVLPDFTEYAIKPSGDNAYTLLCFIPQYYEFAGSWVSTTDGLTTHEAGTRKLPSEVANGAVEVSYTGTNECWVTVYIKPKGIPGDHLWGWATNDFGVVNP